MGTMIAFYVRNGGDANIPAIWKNFPNARVESGQDFVGVVLSDDQFEPPRNELSQLSSDLSTDVIWLSFQSAVDAFEFHHWRGGVELRSLVFGCYEEERTWEHVEGEAEPWEREAFFDPKMLRYPLEFAKSDAEKQELERVWREADIQPGRTEPNIDARESARKVAQFYNFPGWS